MKRMSPQMLVLCWAWILFCAAHLAYGYATYSGLYRWAAELQVSLFGRYLVAVTGILPFLILAAPALSIVRRDYIARREADAKAPGARGQRARAQRSALILVALASLAFIVSGVTWWIGQGKAVPAGDPIQLDLASVGDDKAPEGRVTLQGSVLVDRGITTMTQGFWQTSENFYAPIVARDLLAAPSAYRVFVKRSSVRSGNQPPLRQMFTGSETGILIPGGLPAEVRAILAKNGVQVAEPHWLLGPASAATDHYYTAAGVAGLIGIILLIGGVSGYQGARIKERRSGG